MAKPEMIIETARMLVDLGYTVYLSKNKDYGFYTNRLRVVSFGGCWSFSLDFSGNYQSSHDGTGWLIVSGRELTTEDAADYIAMNAPRWATTEKVRYTTPEQYLAMYGVSSGFTQFTGE
jgi:hypothetical protein